MKPSKKIIFVKLIRNNKIYKYNNHSPYIKNMM